MNEQTMGNKPQYPISEEKEQIWERTCKNLFIFLKEHFYFNEKDFNTIYRLLSEEPRIVKFFHKLENRNIIFSIIYKNNNKLELIIDEREEKIVKSTELFSKKNDIQETIIKRIYCISSDREDLVDMSYTCNLVDEESKDLKKSQNYKMILLPDAIDRQLSPLDIRFINRMSTHHDTIGGFKQITEGLKFGSYYESTFIDNITEKVHICETEIFTLGGFLNFNMPPDNVKPIIDYQYKCKVGENDYNVELEISGYSKWGYVSIKPDSEVTRIPKKILEEIKKKIKITQSIGYSFNSPIKFLQDNSDKSNMGIIK